MIRINRSETLELEGTYVEFPDVEEPELEAVVSELSDNFTDLLSLAAPIINRNEYRRVLQGVNLSADFEESKLNTIQQQSGFDQRYIENVLRLLGNGLRFFTFYIIKLLK